MLDQVIDRNEQMSSFNNFNKSFIFPHKPNLVSVFRHKVFKDFYAPGNTFLSCQLHFLYLCQGRRMGIFMHQHPHEFPVITETVINIIAIKCETVLCTIVCTIIITVLEVISNRKVITSNLPY